jgi:hypothetical protein
MSDERKQSAKVIPVEDFSAEVDELLRYATERGKAGRQTRVSGRRAGPVRTIRADKPDINRLLREELVSFLEDEVVPAVTPAPDGGILDWELQREITKKALIGLKVQKLRTLAYEMRLDKRGRSEELAERIARAYRYNQQEIAQLILDNEEEPEPERGHVDRVFPLAEVPNVKKIAEQLGPVMGRYIRVGVARWFVFEELARRSNSLTLRGTLRTYRTFVTNEQSGNDDTPVEVARIDASPTEASVEIELLDGLEVLRVRGANASQSRGAAIALEAATVCRRLGHLPFPSASFQGPLGAFARSTIFMLDFVESRLARAGIRDRNLTVARFEIENSTGKPSQAEADRPTLREVRFEGDHLLDSVPACRLIGIEGRALIDLSLRVSVGDSSDDPIRLPIRLTLESDHVTVLTGFGRHQPEVSGKLHRDLVHATEHGLAEGIVNAGRLESLARRIDERARSNHEVERATMLSDEDSDDVS